MPKDNSLITHTPDILIIGGGAAGVAAAVGAARQGAKVALIEKNGFLGGKATAAVVGTVCGLYYRSEESEARYVDEGFPKEFAEKLIEFDHSQPFQYKNGLHFLPYHPFSFQRVCDHFVNHPNIQICLQSTLVGVFQKDFHINRIDALIYDQLHHFYPKAVIDCSGEALVASYLEIPVIKSDVYQASAQVFGMSGMGTDDFRVLNLAVMKAVQRGLQHGVLEEARCRVSLVPGSLKKGEVFLKIALPLSVDGQLNRVSEIQQIARELVQEVSTFLIQEVSFFKNTKVSMIAPEVGIRTGKRHEGQCVLTYEDVMGRRKQEYSIARGAWPIEYWKLDRRPEMEYFAMEDYYDIPKGCLHSKHLENLYFAGRNISADDRAIASARVIGTCLGTGFSAGKYSIKN